MVVPGPFNIEHPTLNIQHLRDLSETTESRETPGTAPPRNRANRVTEHPPPYPFTLPIISPAM